MHITLNIKPFFFYRIENTIIGPSLTLYSKNKQISLKVPQNLHLLLDYQKNKIYVVDNGLKKSEFSQQSFIFLLRTSEFSLIRPYFSRLFLKGVGFRCNVQKNRLIFFVGFCHPIEVCLPSYISVGPQKTPSHLILISRFRQKLSAFLFSLKKLKPAAYYTGKGILILQYRERFRYLLLIKKR